MKETFDDLRRIIDILNSENGCPWDLAQTIKSLKTDLLDEAREATDAIDNDDMDNLKEELGDLLMLVVFMSKLAQKDGLFDIDDVVDGICKKLVSRHTYVFGGDKALTAEEALEIWERNKLAEKKAHKI